MKKLFVYLAVFIMLLSFVVAQSPEDVKMVKTTITETTMAKTTRTMNGSDNESGNITQNQNRSGPVSDINGTLVHLGLNNALENVKNEHAKAALQRNMDRFLEKYQARLDKVDSKDVKINVDDETGDVEMQVKEPVKYFGFIKGKAKAKFQIKNNQVVEKRPWGFLYKVEEE